MNSLLSQFDRDGFVILRGVVDPQQLARLVSRIADTIPAGNARGILKQVPEARDLLDLADVRALVTEILGPGALVTRSLLFDKIASANWNVPWHQDQIIAVTERRDLPGFAAWSVKEGIPHVRPPAEVLARVVTLRFHLDPCGAQNGPLKVIPGSHRDGFLSGGQVAQHVAASPPVVCEVEAGDVVVMRPLLLHASDRSTVVDHRRVVHFDLASEELPGGLAWARE